jgi:hypothetical protein
MTLGNDRISCPAIKAVEESIEFVLWILFSTKTVGLKELVNAGFRDEIKSNQGHQRSVMVQSMRKVGIAGIVKSRHGQKYTISIGDILMVLQAFAKDNKCFRCLFALYPRDK